MVVAQGFNSKSEAVKLLMGRMMQSFVSYWLPKHSELHNMLVFKSVC